MNRRSFLLGLLAAPFARLASKYDGWRHTPATPLPLVPMGCVDMAHGSDQNSIWLINWHPPEPPRVFTGPHAAWQRRMWLKGRIS